jgi:TRAP-type C4-dicarboxylate transport system substrate-binding protein
MKLKSIITVSFLFLLFTGAEALTVKMGTLAPEGSPWHKLLREMAEEWREVSQGKVRIKIYAGGVAGDESDMVRKMRIGQLQAAGITSVGLQDIHSDMGILQIPFLLTSDDELDMVMEKLSGRFEEKIEDKGFKVLTWMNAGWVRMFSQDPVVTHQDLSDMTMFVWGERSPMIDAWKSKGIKALGLSPTDIYTMLQAGKINAYCTTPIASLSFQWFALANNMADMKLGPLLGAMVIDKKAWDKMPEDIRPELDRIAREYGTKMIEVTRSYEQEAIDVMQSHGLTVNHVPEKTLIEWRTFAEEVYPMLLPTPELWELYQTLKTYREAANKM